MRHKDQRPENKTLRELLLLSHGCQLEYLNTKNGEMFCSKCLIDFKRLTPKDIDKRLQFLAKRKLAKDKTVILDGACA